MTILSDHKSPIPGVDVGLAVLGLIEQGLPFPPTMHLTPEHGALPTISLHTARTTRQIAAWGQALTDVTVQMRAFGSQHWSHVYVQGALPGGQRIQVDQIVQNCLLPYLAEGEWETGAVLEELVPALSLSRRDVTVLDSEMIGDTHEMRISIEHHEYEVNAALEPDGIIYTSIFDAEGREGEVACAICRREVWENSEPRTAEWLTIDKLLARLNAAALPKVVAR